LPFVFSECYIPKLLGCLGGWLCGPTRIAVEAAEFVACGAVFLLLGDGCEVGDVVGGGHGDTAHPEAGEGGMVVEEGVVLGVGVDEVEGSGVIGTAGFDVAEEAAEEG